MLLRDDGRGAPCGACGFRCYVRWFSFSQEWSQLSKVQTMSRVFLSCFFVFLLGFALPVRSWAESPPPATPPAAPAPTTPAATTPAATTPAPVPKITKLVPSAPLIAPNQPLVIAGTDFKDKVTLNFTDPQGNTSDAQGFNVKDDRLSVVITFGVAGPWNVTAKNDGGIASAPFEFQVANVPMPAYCWRIAAFFLASIVVTVMLVRLFRFVLKSLGAAETAGKWSIGDALSEESTYQPKEIRQKSDIITFASSSRLIALLGLLGILTTVVGIGYAIMWELFLYGTMPDLSGVRTFLYGSACLFAPYLANQVSSVFAPSAATKPADPGATPATAITGIGPASPQAAAAAQLIHITGQNFQASAKLSLTDPQGNSRPVNAADITSVQPTMISLNAILNIPGPWQVSVQNPPADASPAYIFTVVGAPTITGPVAIARPTAQAWDLTGTGFMSGLTVSLATTGAGAAPIAAVIVAVKSTAVTVQATLPAAGPGGGAVPPVVAVVTNPGGFASPAFTIN